MNFPDLVERIERVLLRHGVIQKSAHLVAEVIAAAERDGTRSHGLIRLEGYVSSLKSGWIDGAAVPLVRDAAPGLVVTDARNGFAQVALAESRNLLTAKARAQGIAALVIRNSHHFASLWPDIEGFAEEGFIAVTMINTRSYMTVWGGTKKILGTNPMAFACPRKQKPPVVWDQASSRISHGDLLLAVKDNKELELAVGVDADGNATVSAGRSHAAGSRNCIDVSLQQPPDDDRSEVGVLSVRVARAATALGHEGDHLLTLLCLRVTQLCLGVTQCGQPPVGPLKKWARGSASIRLRRGVPQETGAASREALRHPTP
jgi:hypothetical protein